MATPDPIGTPAKLPGTPAAGRPLSAIELAEAAAEAVRALNHATLPNGGGGPRYPSGIYGTLAELATLANRLPQALQQLSTVLQRQHAAGHVAIDAGTRYAGEPAAAVDAAAVFMQVAEQLAVRLGAALGEASEALAFASYSGPEPGAEAGAEAGSAVASGPGR